MNNSFTYDYELNEPSRRKRNAKDLTFSSRRVSDPCTSPRFLHPGLRDDRVIVQTHPARMVGSVPVGNWTNLKLLSKPYA